MLKSMLLARLNALPEEEQWDLAEGHDYFVIISDSALIAFRHNCSRCSVRVCGPTGAYTDSPSLKANPIRRFTAGLCAVREVYGGALLSMV